MMQGKNGSSGTHPIQVVSRRTGITQDVLRAWERRYGAIHPVRTSTGRRLYTDEDVERLLLLRRVTLAGRRIGSVADLSLETLREMAREDEQAEMRRPAPPAGSGAVEPLPAGSPLSAPGPHLEACMDAVRSLDAPALERALGEAVVALTRPSLLDEVLVPLADWIGNGWRQGSLRIAHEHLASAVVRSFLGSLREAWPLPAGAPAILVTTLAGQLHEIGALLAGATAASAGWRVTYLGPNLPPEEIAAAARQIGVEAVALGITYPPDDPAIVEQLRSLRTYLGEETSLLVGGRAAPAYRDPLEKIGAVLLEDLPAFRDWLESAGS